MRVTFRIPLLWTLLLAFFIACVIACAVAWVILLSTLCSSPRTPVPQVQHVIPYNCHGMKVFISPVQDAMLHWLVPMGLLFGLLSLVAAARVVLAAATARQSDLRGRHDAGPRVRIIAVPPGEAPAWVREKWVGLELPLAPWSTAASRRRAAGVLSGPKSFLEILAALLSRGSPQQSGFQVNVLQALAVLEVKSPDAAQWWRTHTPHLVTPSRFFLFSEHVCEVIE
jgi:hypothetical protein